MPNRIWDAAVRYFGDIKYFKIPPVLVYDPSSYQVKGKDMREAMDLVRPGDVLVRRYDGYLDGLVIPGYFSHAGLYLGKVDEADRALCRELVRSRGRFRRTSRSRPRTPDEQFAVGEQMVVHALAEGVLVEDLLNFCRCDAMAILRLPEVLAAAAPSQALEGLSEAEARIQARLLSGRDVTRAEVVPVVREVALSKVGYPYDTTFDFTDFQRLSCTEFVYFATRCLASALDVAPRKKRIARLFPYTIIDPDEYVRSKVLRAVWKSRSVDEERFRELRPGGLDPAVPDEAARVA